jgi:dTDP-4-dehydrorhamnose reductase
VFKFKKGYEMKIVVLGANGMLGSMLVDYLSQYHEVVGTTRKQFDALKPDFSVVQDCDWIINAIGEIPQRHRHSTTMYEVNGIFPWKLLEEMRKPIIHITTDCVYSGQKGNYVETDVCDCVEEYGQSKWTGEFTKPYFNTLRCSIIGLEPDGNYSLLKWFLSQSHGAKVNGYLNYHWNGVTTLAFAKVCKGIIENGYCPEFQHLVPADSMSKYFLLRLFAAYFEREDISISPVNIGMKIDRRLSTLFLEVNLRLWQMAGYSEPPSIERMIKELAEYAKERELLKF